MKIGRFELTIGKRILKDNEVLTKSASTGFGRLFELVRESLVFRGKITKAYEQSSAVYKAVTAIADNVPQAELALYQEKSEIEVTDKHDDIMTLLHHPNTFQSGHDFFQEVAGFYALNGEAFIIKETSIGQQAGSSKLPASLCAYDPKEFEEILDKPTGKLVAWKYKGQRYELTEVIHIKGFNPYNKYRGQSPLKAIDGEIQIDFQSLCYNQKFFENDATPGLMLTTDKSLTQDQRDRLKDSFTKENRGTENAHKTKVLDNGIKPVQTGVNQKDMQFLEQKKYTEESILGAWRAPKALFNITEQLNYATFTGQMKIFWIYTIVPILRKVEEGLNYALIEPIDPTIYFAFKLDNIPAFQEDFGDKVTTAKILFDMGFTSNEINQKLGLGFEEEDWRDKWWIPFNLSPAGEIPDVLKLGYANPANLPPGAGAVDTGATDPATGLPPDATGAKPPADGTSPKFFELRVWKNFLITQTVVEQRFVGKMRRYFYEMRGEILDHFSKHGAGHAEKIVNWGEKDHDLRNLTAPLIRDAIIEGIKIGRQMVKTKSLLDDILNARMSAYLSVRATRIVGINRTIQNQLKATLEEGITAGEAVPQLSDRVRDVFNAASSRALTIARTETAGAVNGGTEMYYREVGVDKKRWVTAGDELVRESHRAIDGETVDAAARFDNGLRFPGDQEGEASEVINCRCTLIPVI